jgi:hypothetical protein
MKNFDFGDILKIPNDFPRQPQMVNDATKDGLPYSIDLNKIQSFITESQNFRKRCSNKYSCASPNVHFTYLGFEGHLNALFNQLFLSKKSSSKSSESDFSNDDYYYNLNDGSFIKKEHSEGSYTNSASNKGGKLPTLPYESGNKLEDVSKPKVQINYVNTAIFGSIGGGVGYLVAKKLIKTDKVIIPILIGAAAFAYYQIDMSKKM